VTNLVEKIHFVLTLHRDDDDAFPFDDIMGLKILPVKGRQRIGNVTYEWVKTGAEEEYGAGDN
jgi:hypothetical protein